MSAEDLGQQEQAVLDAITANPFAGQQEIAAALGLARSTVAAHIVQLVTGNCRPRLSTLNFSEGSFIVP